MVQATAFEMVFGRSAIPNKLTVNPEAEDFNAIFDMRDRLQDQMTEYVDYNIQKHKDADAEKDELYKEGDLIIFVNETTNKNSTNRFHRNVYRVTKCKDRAVYGQGIFGRRETRSASIDRVKRFWFSRDLLQLDSALQKFFGPADEPEEDGEVPEFVNPPTITSRVTRNLRKKKQLDRQRQLRYTYALDYNSDDASEIRDDVSRNESMRTTSTGLSSFLIGPPIDLADEVDRLEGSPAQRLSISPEPDSVPQEANFTGEPNIEWDGPPPDAARNQGIDDIDFDSMSNDLEMASIRSMPQERIDRMGVPSELKTANKSAACSIQTPPSSDLPSYQSSNRSSLLLKSLNDRLPKTVTGADNRSSVSDRSLDLLDEILLRPYEQSTAPRLSKVEEAEKQIIDDKSTTLGSDLTMLTDPSKMSSKGSSPKSVSFAKELQIIPNKDEENELDEEAELLEQNVSFSSQRSDNSPPVSPLTPYGPEPEPQPEKASSPELETVTKAKSFTEPVSSRTRSRAKPAEASEPPLGEIRDIELGHKAPMPSEFSKSMRSKVKSGISNIASKISNRFKRGRGDTPSETSMRRSERVVKRPKYLDSYV